VILACNMHLAELRTQCVRSAPQRGAARETRGVAARWGGGKGILKTRAQARTSAALRPGAGAPAGGRGQTRGWGT